MAPTDTGGGPQREMKHFSIVHGMARLIVAISGLEDLLADITGGPHSEQPKLGPSPVESTSLVEVLNTAGDQTAEKAERILELTQDIRAQIL